jgi:hypothetical protein
MPLDPHHELRMLLDRAGVLAERPDGFRLKVVLVEIEMDLLEHAARVEFRGQGGRAFPHRLSGRLGLLESLRFLDPLRRRGRLEAGRLRHGRLGWRSRLARRQGPEADQCQKTYQQQASEATIHPVTSPLRVKMMAATGDLQPARTPNEAPNRAAASGAKAPKRRDYSTHTRHAFSGTRTARNCCRRASGAGYGRRTCPWCKCRSFPSGSRRRRCAARPATSAASR